MASELEKRVENLEHELSVVKSAMNKLMEKGKPWWEGQAGVFKDDTMFDEIVEAGKQYRQAQTEAAE
jgi:hypothetical protein